MIEIFKKFVLNAVNSWVTTGVGAAYGLPIIWGQLQFLFDAADLGTTPDWGIVLKGLGGLVLGMFVRDHTKALIPAKK